MCIRIKKYPDTLNVSKGTNRTKMKSFIELFKNVKFLILNVIVLVVLGIAFLSGDGEKIALNTYENITGNKFEKFSPVDNISHPSYIALKDKVFRDLSVKIDNVSVSVFKVSDTSHKYRVEFKDTVYYYKIEKSADGIFIINRQE